MRTLEQCLWRSRIRPDSLQTIGCPQLVSRRFRLFLGFYVTNSWLQLVSVTGTHYREVQKWGLESYFGSDLKWRMFRGDIDRATVVAAMSRDEEIDSDQELPSEVQFDHQVTCRSRGTVRHDSLEWTKHHESFSQNHGTLALSSHKRWTREIKPVPFGLVIRIGDTGAQVPIYTAITNEIDVLVEQRV